MTQEENSAMPAFIADCHLGKLAKYLRLMGFDTLYFNHIDDNDLLALAAAENRVVLTRDKFLSERKTDARIVFLKDTDTRRALREVLNTFDIRQVPASFSRCIVCNTPLQVVEKEQILHRIPPKVIEHFSYFEYCPACDRIYWHGDHYRHMQQFLRSVLCD